MTRRQRMGQATTIEPGATPAGTVAATPACGPRTSGGRERIAWMALLLVTLAIHLVALGARPPHHDEAVHGDFGDNPKNRYFLEFILRHWFSCLASSSAARNLAERRQESVVPFMRVKRDPDGIWKPPPLHWPYDHALH